MCIYEPSEDSFLLQQYVKKYTKKGDIVLDMGTGSGIQAIAASKIAKQVIAADISKEALQYAQKMSNMVKNIEFIESDLFQYIPKTKFDLIIFNAPYLKQEKNIEDKTIFGGKAGYETTVRLINQVGEYLANKGIILLVSSSLINQQKISETIKNNLLEYEILEKEHIFFEDIMIYKITKSDLLKKLKFLNIQFFAKGKRGLIHIASYKCKKVAIKTKKPESQALNSVQNEIRILKILNKKDIGPKLVIYGTDFLAYEFVEGEFILDFIKRSGRKEVLSVILEVLDQCYKMDKLGINKQEMSHPQKHILIGKDNEVTLIDFERARYSENPKNANQFLDFIITKQMLDMLREKSININKNSIIELASGYKINGINFKKIKNYFQ